MIAGINRINHDAVAIEYSRYSNHMVNYEMKASRTSSISNSSWFRQMDDMLLRKVEELTLYVIEQEKELDELKKENEELRDKNAKQDEEIEDLKQPLDPLKGT